MRRFNYNATAAIKRLVNDGGGNTQSTVTTLTGVSYRGYFSPIALTKGIEVLGVADQLFQFVTEGKNDIRSGDQLIINGLTYGVRGVARYRNLSQDILNCSLNLVTDNDGI
jgi:hypothetical protein